MNALVAFIVKYKWVIIAIIVLLIIIYIAYKRGSAYRPGAVKLPPDIQSGDPNATTFDPTRYTDDIFNDLDCYFCFHSAVPYENLLTLSNTQVVAVWNDWNRRYYEKFGHQNLITAITNDFSPNGNWGQTTEIVLTRFKALGLQ